MLNEQITRLKDQKIKFLALFAVILAPFIFGFVNNSTYTFTFFNLILMFIISSTSWDIMYGQTGYLSFAHSTPFGIGAYCTAIFLVYFGLSPFVTALVGGLIAALFAVVLGVVCLRLKGLYFSFGTIFTNQAFQLIAIVLPFTGGSLGMHLPIPDFGPLLRQRIFYLVFLLLALGTLLLKYLVIKSKFGLGCVAIREDEEACEVIGINTTYIKVLTYALSCLPMGVMGGLYSYYMLYIDPVSAFGSVWTFNPVLMTIVGGSGTILGPILGSILLFFLQEVFRYSIPLTFEGLHMMIFAAILVTVIIFMPQGIIPTLKKRFKFLSFLF